MGVPGQAGRAVGRCARWTPSHGEGGLGGKTLTDLAHFPPSPCSVCTGKRRTGTVPAVLVARALSRTAALLPRRSSDRWVFSDQRDGNGTARQEVQHLTRYSQPPRNIRHAWSSGSVRTPSANRVTAPGPPAHLLRRLRPAPPRSGPSVQPSGRFQEQNPVLCGEGQSFSSASELLPAGAQTWVGLGSPP